MKKFLSVALLLAGSSLAASAATPLWLRDVKISPSGEEIVFTYRGSLYKVPAKGGKAVRLTTQDSYDANPVWSPDGSKIAFASDRNGNFDVFVMDAAGGPATRLTSQSGPEIPQTFSPDGKYVLFSAAIQDAPASLQFPSGRLTELYKVPVAGGAFTQILSSPAVNVVYLPDGKNFIYNDVKGMENEWRKHHTSSVTRDIWLFDSATGRHSNLTDRGGEDLYPAVSADGKTVYFLSERDGGSMNLYSFPTDNPSQVTALTDFKTHPLRFLSRSGNGTMAFTYDGEIYTMRDGTKPEKVAIDITVDDAEVPETVNFSSGAYGANPSPDGKQVAFVHRGDIFVTSDEYNTTKQITATPEEESSPVWGDNRTLYYVSKRSGHNNIYKAVIARKEDPNFPNATLIKEEALFPDDGVDRMNIMVSPDGKKMAFVQDRRNIAVMDIPTKKVHLVTHGETYTARDGEMQFEWSPDGKWLVSAVDVHQRDPYYDIAVINAETGELTNITNSAYMNINPHWVMNGDAIVFLSERYGMKNHASWGSTYDAMIVFTNKEAFDRYKMNEEDYALYQDSEKKAKKDEEGDDKAADKKGSKKSDKKKAPEAKKSKDIKMELDGIEDRIVRLTPFSSSISDLYVTPDGESLYFLSEGEDGYDLWKKDMRKGDISIAKKMNGPAMGMIPDKSGKTVFLSGGGKIQKLNTANDKVTNVSYRGTQKIDYAKEREFMFNDILAEETERFYRKDMHGVDWKAMGEAYRKFLPHINNNYDFAEMGSELLGELNVSHTGAGYRHVSSNSERTATLGLLYDLGYSGNGLKVAEVITGSPFDKAGTRMVPGSVVTAINGNEITPATDYARIFNGLGNKKTLVSLTTPSGEKVDETIRPISTGKQNALLYDRWVRRNEQIVDSLSNGRLGYVHLESMSDDSYRNVYSNVLGKYNERDGIVIDTRWNGGGRLHEDIEVLFSGDKYLTQEIQGVVSGQMPSRRWNKPSIMVICEANYSNAHGTPWVYKNRGLGKLVGMPVPGTMSSVNWVTMQDPSMYYGIPVVGFKDDNGRYLENQQLEPDFKVAQNPADIVRGVDDQLRVAVERLLIEIDKPR